MLNRIVISAVVFSILVALPGDPCRAAQSDDELDLRMEGPVAVAGAVWCAGSLAIAMYNRSRMEADDPSKGGGAVGVLVGTFTTVLGGAALFYEHPVSIATGFVCIGVGGYSVYTGVKSLGAVQRKFLEEEERGLTLDPILIEDGSGGLVPGLQVSLEF
jgi:hypothetical protein